MFFYNWHQKGRGRKGDGGWEFTEAEKSIKYHAQTVAKHPILIKAQKEMEILFSQECTG